MVWEWEYNTQWQMYNSLSAYRDQNKIIPLPEESYVIAKYALANMNTRRQDNGKPEWETINQKEHE